VLRAGRSQAPLAKDAQRSASAGAHAHLTFHPHLLKA